MNNRAVLWTANVVPTALHLQAGAAPASAADWPYISNTSWPHHDQWLMQTIICGAHHPPGAGAADPSAGGLRDGFGPDRHRRNTVATRPQPGQMGSGVLQNSVGAWRSAGIAVSENVAGRVDERVDVGAQANPAGIYPVLALPPPPQHPAHGSVPLHAALTSGFNNRSNSHGDTSQCRPAPAVQQPHGTGVHHLPPRLVYPDRPASATGPPALRQPPGAAQHMSNLGRIVGEEVVGVGLTNHRSAAVSQLRSSFAVGTPVAIAGALQAGLTEAAPAAGVVEKNSSRVGATSESTSPVDRDDVEAGRVRMEAHAKRSHSPPLIPTSRPSPSCGSNKRSSLTSSTNANNVHTVASPDSANTSVSPSTGGTRAPAADVGATRHTIAKNRLRSFPLAGAVSGIGIGVGVDTLEEDSSAPGGITPSAGGGVENVLGDTSDMSIPETANEDPDSWLAGVVWTTPRVKRRRDVPPSPIWHALRNDSGGGHDSAALFPAESDESPVLNNGTTIETGNKVRQSSRTPLTTKRGRYSGVIKGRNFDVVCRSCTSE